MGLADYGDGADSSDADPDSGAEEGGERGVPCRPPAPRVLSRHPVPPRSSRPRPGRARGGPRTWRESRSAELRGGGGEGAGGATASCKMGEPGCKRRWGGTGGGGSRERKSLGFRGNPRSLARSRAGSAPISPIRALGRIWGLRRGGDRRARPGTSLSPRMLLWKLRSDVVAKKGSRRRQRDWQGRRQLRVSVLPRVASRRGRGPGAAPACGLGAPGEMHPGDVGVAESGRGFPGIQANTVVRTPYLRSVSPSGHDSACPAESAWWGYTCHSEVHCLLLMKRI